MPVTFLYPMKTSENQRFSDVFRVYSNVTGVVLVSLLLFLTYFTPSSSVSIVNFEQINAGWVVSPEAQEKEVKTAQD